MLPGQRAPWALWTAAGVLVAVFFIQSLLASRTKSLTSDEPVHIAAGLEYVSYGEIRTNPQHPPLLKELAGLALLITGERLPAEGALLAARLPLLLLSTLLGVLIFLWGRRLVGDAAALAALLLYTLDPTILGHGYLVTMDTGLATFTVLFFFLLWRYMGRPDTLRLVWCGLAMGLMLSAKFSGLVFVPVAAVLLFTNLPWRAALKAFAILCVLATIVIQLVYLSPGGLFLYTSGMQRVNADHNPDYLVFLAGRLQHHFLSYFAAAWLLKEPIATLVAVVIGVPLVVKSKVRIWLLLPPAVFFAAHTLFADDLGVRYIIPAFPFLYLIGGAGAAWLWQRQRIVATALAVWLAVTSFAIYPDGLSYFNEAARPGVRWLDDSNVDWGQGLKQVKDWLDRNAPGRTIRLAAFPSSKPETYGIPAERIGIEDLAQAPKPGLYVVSAHLVARVPALSPAGEWLRQRAPVAIVGHAMYVYDIR